MSCLRCGIVTRRRGDELDGYARTLCICEARQRCGRKGCASPAVQAALEADEETVEAYLCQTHAIQPGLEPAAPPPPPKAAPALEIELPKKKALEVEMPKKKPAPKKAPAQAHDPDALDRATQVVCLGAGHLHNLTERKWVTHPDRQTSHCPRCPEPGYRML